MRDLVIRSAVEADVPAMASLCQRAIRETNAADYSPDIIARLITDFGAAEVGRRMADRKYTPRSTARRSSARSASGQTRCIPCSCTPACSGAASAGA